MLDEKKLLEENQKLKRAVEELTILNDIATAISSILSIEELTQLIVKKCIKWIGAEQGAIMLLKEELAQPLKTFVRVKDTHFQGISYRLGMSITGWILKNKKPLMVNDLLNDSRFQGLSESDLQVKSFLTVPLTLKNELIGALTLFNKTGGKEFTTEDQRLLSIVAMQSAQVIENARLYEEEKKLILLEEELKTAHNIQTRLLPKKLPEIAGFDIFGTMFSAKEVGGDYYDLIHISEQKLGIAIADVSGKGMPAALLMSNLQATLRGQIAAKISVAETVSQSNTFLYHNMERGKFITLFYGVLNFEEKSLVYTNAGHNYPIIFNSSGIRKLEKGGLLLGIMETNKYEEEKENLNSGDMILFYTDGATDILDEKEEEFGEEKLIELVKENLKLTAKEITEKIIDEIKKFQGVQEQADDITLIVVKIL
jgi:sigma-B regulation protein RsbU (phosphoserine phosphatase)